MIEDIHKKRRYFLTNKNNELPIFFWDESYTSLERGDNKKYF